MMQEMEDSDFTDPVEVRDNMAADSAVEPRPDAGVGEPPAGHRYYEDSREGFFKAWSKVVHAEDKEIFW